MMLTVSKSGLQFAGSCLGVVLGLAGALTGQSVAAEVTTVQAPKGKSFSAVWQADLNGDQLKDLLLLAVEQEDGKSRKLQAHYRRREGLPFSSKADAEVRLTPDVVGISLVDLEASPGKEIVLFNRRAAYRLDPKAKGRARLRKLCNADFLWQFPDDDKIIEWNTGILDLNGDGLDDMLLPEPGSVRVLLQKRNAKGQGEFAEAQILVLPIDRTTEVESRGAFSQRGRTARKELAFKVGVGNAGDDTETGPMLTVSESLPAPQLQDWDGDGDMDLVMRTTESLHIWTQQGGQFKATPDSYPIPVVMDKSRLLDVSYSAHLADLNGDRRSDCIFVAGNPKAKDVRAQVLVYIQGAGGRGPRATTAEAPLFGPKGFPQQLITLAGFVARARLDDVNGDGTPDLVVATFEPDLIDSIRSRGKEIDLGLSVFLNQGGKFSQRADVVSALTMNAKSIRKGRQFLQARFLGDLSGDGLGELLVQDAPRSIRLRSLTRSGRQLALQKSDAWKLTLPGEVSLRTVSQRGPGTACELLFFGGQEIVFVRLGK